MRAALERGAALGFIPGLFGPPEGWHAARPWRLVLAGGVYVPPMMLTALPPGIVAGVAPQRRRRHARAPASSQNARAPAQRADRAAVEVLQLLSQGKPNKLIGRSLGISEGTVKIHLAAIFRALNVRNRTEAGGRGAGAHRSAGLNRPDLTQARDRSPPLVFSAVAPPGATARGSSPACRAASAPCALPRRVHAHRRGPAAVERPCSSRFIAAMPGRWKRSTRPCTSARRRRPPPRA